MIAAMEPPLGTTGSPREIARAVRSGGGVPWRRLFGYLRPELGRFLVALVGMGRRYG